MEELLEAIAAAVTNILDAGRRAIDWLCDRIDDLDAGEVSTEVMKAGRPSPSRSERR